MFFKGKWYKKAEDGNGDEVCTDHRWEMMSRTQTPDGLIRCLECAMPRLETCDRCKQGSHSWLDGKPRRCACCGYVEVENDLNICPSNPKLYHHHKFKWSGDIPCTGVRQCIYCGYTEGEEVSDMGKIPFNRLKYPSMTGPDQMYQVKEEGHMGTMPEASGAYHDCNCPECMEKRAKYNKKFNEEVLVMGQALYVFKTVAVDRQTCEVVAEKTVIGGEQDRGLLDLDLSKEQKDWMKSGRLQIFTSNVGNFTRFLPEVSLTEKFTE